MCSIMGAWEMKITQQQFADALYKTHSRGPDSERIYSPNNNVLLGFQRLAIMGLDESGMQPFILHQKSVVCNGEIYGFRGIKKQLQESGYSFQSNSDCEILIPLYEQFGTKMFAMLDAEFALILYDADTDQMIAARDPIGIRPLFYGMGEEGIVFSSEAKNICGLVDEVHAFPPGYYYANGEFTCYCDIAKRQTYIKDDQETIYRNIHDLLVSGVRKRLDADAPVGFLLSGGLDSSLVCAIAARELKKPIRTFAIGMREDAIDLKYAREVAEYLHSDHTEIFMSRDEVVSSLEEVIQILGTFDITTIRASMGMYLICKAIHKQSDVRVLLTGEISDEIFGYKYTDYAPDAESFQQEAEKRLHELYI